VDKLIKLIDKLHQLKPSPGGDRFRFKIQITDDSGQREFDVPEDAMPEELISIPKLKP
jgi:emfourin